MTSTPQTASPSGLYTSAEPALDSLCDCSLAIEPLVHKNKKRNKKRSNRTPNHNTQAQCARPTHTETPCIEIKPVAERCEPRGVAGHVAKRADRKTGALAPPPSMTNPIGNSNERRGGDGQEGSQPIRGDEQNNDGEDGDGNERESEHEESDGEDESAAEEVQDLGLNTAEERRRRALQDYQKERGIRELLLEEDQRRLRNEIWQEGKISRSARYSAQREFRRTQNLKGPGWNFYVREVDKKPQALEGTQPPQSSSPKWLSILKASQAKSKYKLVPKGKDVWRISSTRARAFGYPAREPVSAEMLRKGGWEWQWAIQAWQYREGDYDYDEIVETLVDLR